MIEELSIRDLGVIGQASLPLGPGFTAITGETGAGKTMVVTALGLLLGERSDSGAVRQGAGEAVVAGTWEVSAHGEAASRAREAGGELDEFGEGRAALMLSRSVAANGRSRAVVGGRSAPVGVLHEIGGGLVVVHGQSDQIRLRSASAQREALDRYAGEELRERLAEYRQVHRRWQEARGDLDVLVAEQDARVREAAELRAAIEEIERIDPKPGEDRELGERAERLGNLEELRLAAGEALAEVSGQGAGDAAPEGPLDAASLVESARRALDRVAAHDPALAPAAELLASASYTLAEASTELAGYLDGLDADRSRELELVNERRAELAGLARRHGEGGLEAAIELLERGSARLLELDGDGDRIEQLAASVEADLAEARRLAELLSALRIAAAERLGAAVTAELAALAMPDAVLQVRVSPQEEIGEHGRDQIELLLRPHAGAPARPLARGASGGELSRVMLAIEVVLGASDPVPTFVFDEVDAGVGGASAIEIGRRLARLAQSSQVIVVTHLAQVAAFAGNHLTVVKDRDGAITASSVHRLEGEERVAEMARLLSGLAESESGLDHARELLALQETV
ncbi:DNA repair protein RecN [Homoserinibacter sp. YIM 151385]|uniref:DNA repair protein RecN n=1 Tax=Homoserinibacter sp. YIM 151385 TaxID=2985506 RepID=UPI0022F0631A|nr:DNA repair protein RecN [Homoserinibacter sp. YIM 151385]WBU38853.1 DNA repair protein RecN [Homoserinibacter sp. YIM 151385]